MLRLSRNPRNVTASPMFPILAKHFGSDKKKVGKNAQVQENVRLAIEGATLPDAFRLRT